MHPPRIARHPVQLLAPCTAVLASLLATGGCSSQGESSANGRNGDAGNAMGGHDGAGSDGASDGSGDVTLSESGADGAPDSDAAGPGDASGSDAAATCTTRITYGEHWIHGPNHPEDYDVADGVVSWDGACQVDASGNAFATLSNGWQPYFVGRRCVIALDYEGGCPEASHGCATRVSYGPTWIPAPNHPASFDDVDGVLTWDGICHANGSSSWAQLSNGWTPGFDGADACDLAFRHTQCGGLYANPVVDADCPDPGVEKVGDEYYMVCTSGSYGYPIRSSKDLVHWAYRGTVFTQDVHPSWASGDFWAPEIHGVGGKFVVYFSARASATGTFAIGAAAATGVLGPYEDIGHPIVAEPPPGAIDAHFFRAPDAKQYLLWKVDGNAAGAPTPIRIQELSADGLSVVGAPTTILSNTLAWEGALVEGPWMVAHGAFFYLFYSANGYASPSYAVGVARSDSPLGPFTKAPDPVLTSRGAWAGPGHGSVVVGPHGDWVHVYHAWVAGHVGQPPGRVVLADRIQWDNEWPVMRTAPSSGSQPVP